MPIKLTRFLKVEQLEDRAVPATFNGTALDDRFSLNYFGPNSVLVTRYNASNVLQGQAVVANEGITINGLGGSDQINIDGPLPLAFGFDGGSGTDTIAQYNPSKISVQDFGATGYFGLNGGGGIYFNDTNVEQVLFYGTSLDDALNIESGPSYTGLYFSGGAGSDTVNFNNTVSATLDQVNASTTQVSRPSQANVFLNDDDLEQIGLNGTAGADLFTINTPPPQRVGVAIAAGRGSDVASVSASTATVTDYGSYGQVATGAGAIYFGDGELEQLNLRGTAGADTFTVNAMTSTVLAVSGGAGSDTLILPNQTNVGLQDYGTYSVATPVGSAPVFLSDTDIESIYLRGTAGVDTFNFPVLPNYASVAVQGFAGVDAINLLGVSSTAITGFSGYGLVAPSTGGGLYFSDDSDNLIISASPGTVYFNVIQRPQNTLLTFNGLGGYDEVSIRNLPGAVVTDAGAYGIVTASGGAPIKVSDTDVEYLRLYGNDNANTFDLSAGVTYTILSAFGGAGNDTEFGSPRGDDLIGGGGKDTLYGNGGADNLNGNGGDDWLFGGDGNDFLDGGGGDDVMRGDAGDDYLQGYTGNDSIYGGTGINTLNGDAGADRILTLTRNGTTNTIDSPEDQDAEIVFADTSSITNATYSGYSQTFQFSPASWTDAEIDRVDIALGDLHKAANNTKLLKSAAGGELKFLRYGAQQNFTDVVEWSVKHFENGEIGFADPVFATTAVVAYKGVYYALAQNWDTPSFYTFNINAFYDLSGWIALQSSPGALFSASTAPVDNWWYRTSSQFARAFGKDSPYDDYATTWETYFMAVYHGSEPSGNLLVTVKYQNIADFIAWIHTP